MAYNPPTQSIVDNDTRNTPSNEAIFEALKSKADTNLQNLSFSGSNGQFLTLSGGVPVWGNVPGALPTQTGNTDKVLYTNGTSAEWQYAGLGSTSSYPADTIILGRAKPVSIAGVENTLMGTGAGNALTSGNRNFLVQKNAGLLLTTQNDMIAVGSETLDALATASDPGSVAIGYRALTAANNFATGGFGNGAGSHVAIGYLAGSASTAGRASVYIGDSAGVGVTTGGQNTYIGPYAGSSGNSSNSVFVGYAAGRGNTGNNNVIVGNYLGSGNFGSGNQNVVLGSYAGNNITGAGSNNNTMIGYNTAGGATTTVGAIAVGHSATAGGTAIAIGVSSGAGGTNTIVIGQAAGRSAATGANNIIMGNAAGDALTTGSASILIGQNAGGAITTSASNVIIGDNAGIAVTTEAGSMVIIGSGAENRGTNSVTIGQGAGVNGTANNCVFIGSGAVPVGSAINCIALGRSAGAASNEFGVGSSTSQINTMLLGRGGASQTVANAVTLMTMRASGTADTSMTGGTLTLAGSQGTGTGAGGSVYLATAPAAGATGSTTNAHVNRMEVTAAGDVKVLTGQLTVETAGKGLSIKEGSNAKMGTATMVAGTVTVSTTAVTANSRIFLTIQSLGTVASPKAIAVTARSANTFTITSADNTDTSVVAWMLVEPA